MKKIFLLIFVYFFSLNISYGNFDNLSDEEKECLEIMKESGYNLDENFVSTNSGYTTNDGLTGVDYIGKDIFKKQTYNFGEKSQMSKKDIFRYFELIGVDLGNSFFYEKELNFYKIKNEEKNEFLSCALSINTNLKGKLANLKKGDANVVYTTTPDKINIEIIEKNNKNYKKIITTTYFKDFYGKENVLQIDKIYIVPQNNNLNNYYDLYNLADKYKEIVDWYKLKIDNTDRNSYFLKEIYNKDGISIKRYFIGDKDTSDPYGIRYRFVNGHNFLDDFAHYKRHHIFEDILKINPDLAKYITIVGNTWDRTEKTYGGGQQLSLPYWVNYFLGANEEIPKDKIEQIPYFSSEQDLSTNSFYKVSNLFKTRHDYYRYMYNEIYNEENLNNPDKLISELNNKIITGDFKELKDKTEEFYKEYEIIKNSNNIKDKEKFIKKYINDYPRSHIFEEDQSLKEIKLNLDLKKDTIIIDTIKTDNKIKYLIIIGLIFIILILILLFKRKKK